MAQKPFANDPFGHPSEKATAGSSTTPLDITSQESQAVEDLLRYRQLTTPCGRLHEYTIQTSLSANRHAWHYRCSVVQHATEVEELFPPIFIDRTAAIGREPITEDKRRQFAIEAVEKHFARCAEIEAHLASLLPPQTRHRSRWVLMGLILGIVCLAAYVTAGTQLGWWRRPSSGASPTVHWKHNSVFHQAKSGQVFSLLLPALEPTPPNFPVDVTLEAQDHIRSWLRLEQSPLRLSGTAPNVTSDMRYTFFVQAKVQDKTTHKLHIDFSVTRGEQTPSPIPPPKVNEECLLKRLRGEQC